MTTHTVPKRELVTEPEDTVDLTSDPEEGTSSPDTFFFS
jgi:hypothetical protein